MKRISLAIITLQISSQLFAQGGPPGNPLLKPEKQRPVIEAGTLRLQSNELNALSRVRKGGRINLPSLDSFTGNQDEPLEFQRMEVFAPGARVHLVTDSGTVRIHPGQRHFFMASNSTTGIGIAVDLESGATQGYAIKGGDELKISGQMHSSLEFRKITAPEQGVRECGTVLADQPAESLAFLSDGIAGSQSAAAAGSGLDFQAVIAVDTDTEWLAGFGNDTTAATSWIEDLFLAMNVMFERDVATRLLLGDVFLRTGSDPYTLESGRSDMLDEFGEYWRVNLDAVDRDFAAMLSGRDIDSWSFSGVAWLDQYCQNGRRYGSRTIGSYSYNALGERWSAGSAAKFVAHELGHNLGSPHTHCYDPPVDKCYAGEGGCFDGPVECPVTGKGKGTTMSYCHFSSSSVSAGCGSTTDFHPTVQALFQDRLSSNSPNCIAVYTDTDPDPEVPIFDSSFENG
jgi:hypothetical protein